MNAVRRLTLAEFCLGRHVLSVERHQLAPVVLHRLCTGVVSLFITLCNYVTCDSPGFRMHDGVFLPDRHNTRSGDVHDTSELNVLLQIVHACPYSPLPTVIHCLALTSPHTSQFQSWRTDSTLQERITPKVALCNMCVHAVLSLWSGHVRNSVAGRAPRSSAVGHGRSGLLLKLGPRSSDWAVVGWSLQDGVRRPPLLSLQGQFTSVRKLRLPRVSLRQAAGAGRAFASWERWSCPDPRDPQLCGRQPDELWPERFRASLIVQNPRFGTLTAGLIIAGGATHSLSPWVEADDRCTTSAQGSVAVTSLGAKVLRSCGETHDIHLNCRLVHGSSDKTISVERVATACRKFGWATFATGARCWPQQLVAAWRTKPMLLGKVPGRRVRILPLPHLTVGTSFDVARQSHIFCESQHAGASYVMGGSCGDRCWGMATFQPQMMTLEIAESKLSIVGKPYQPPAVHIIPDKTVSTKCHGKLLPNNIRCLIVGLSNCGKTTLMIDNFIYAPGWLDFGTLCVFKKSGPTKIYQFKERYRCSIKII
ncbi:hypothetical protein PR048_009179 [Dryococelus australis]|uniref:Uncharacterized protein n=1 Tax=Dryococelus australis TaxID=614101 RepID=A0ABQ9HZ54_9NEOP|nr:hypothetical protein PR048_009179 [Dryococelus australis]